MANSSCYPKGTTAQPSQARLWEVTPHELNSTSPIKFTTPVTWQMSSTPLFGKRKLTLLEDSDSLDASSYKNGGRKKKCAGLLLYDDASSTKVEVLSCRTSLQSSLTENLR